MDYKCIPSLTVLNEKKNQKKIIITDHGIETKINKKLIYINSRFVN